VTDNHKYLNF